MTTENKCTYSVPTGEVVEGTPLGNMPVHKRCDKPTNNVVSYRNTRARAGNRKDMPTCEEHASARIANINKIRSYELID